MLQTCANSNYRELDALVCEKRRYGRDVSSQLFIIHAVTILNGTVDLKSEWATGNGLWELERPFSTVFSTGD
jgi:hypothetical protein